MPDSASQRIAANLALLREQIAAAAESVGRTADEVTLVAVTKYVDVPLTKAVLSAGSHDLGESRPQQLWEKGAALAGENVRWHLIGSLQRNKVARTIALRPLIHSGSSLSLLEEIQMHAQQQNCEIDVLLEVNISGDSSKHGFGPAELNNVLEKTCEWSHLRVRGLMAMSGLNANAAESEKQFAAVRDLRDQLARSAPPNIKLQELSLGMSGDFPAAIRQGATLVRIGSAIFSGVAL